MVSVGSCDTGAGMSRLMAAALGYIIACSCVVANEVAVVAAVLVDGANEAEDTSEGATVVGGVKKVPSSRVSKKSLRDDKQSSSTMN